MDFGLSKFFFVASIRSDQGRKRDACIFRMLKELIFAAFLRVINKPYSLPHQWLLVGHFFHRFKPLIRVL